MKNGIDWESLGFSVVGTAQNGKEALELIEEYHPDLLISDIKMPFMDGLELSKTIHENYINTKIILFSGWDDFEYARTAISYAAFENSPSSSYLLPVSAQVIKKIQDGKTDCIYIKNTYELGYESIQMLDTYSRNKYMKDISIP